MRFELFSVFTKFYSKSNSDAQPFKLNIKTWWTDLKEQINYSMIEYNSDQYEITSNKQKLKKMKSFKGSKLQKCLEKFSISNVFLYMP